MVPNLDSVHGKIERAEFHAKTLFDEINLWLQSNPFEIRKVVNGDSTRYSIIAYLVGTEPPIKRWTLMVGDCVHNLRCALDHLVYAIAVHESEKEPPPDERTLMFPITDTPENFIANDFRIASLSDPVKRAIEGVQPFKRPHTALPPILGLIRDYDNVDKHRLLRMANASIGEGDITLEGTSNTPGNNPTFIPFTKEALQDKDELFAAVFALPAPNLRFSKVDVDMLIALFHRRRDSSDPPSAERSECITLMKQLIAEVKEVVGLVSAAVV